MILEFNPLKDLPKKTQEQVLDKFIELIKKEKLNMKKIALQNFKCRCEVVTHDDKQQEMFNED
jgi:hypothetical protein|tara:strand:- start:200 stop:388 length:189 start_codon:yes stop_codon:yes gene_type:complete